MITPLPPLREYLRISNEIDQADDKGVLKGVLLS